MSATVDAITRTLRRVMVFIDGSNFLAGLDDFQKEKGKKFTIDCSGLIYTLINKARSGRWLIDFELIKANYYGSESMPNTIKHVKDKTISPNDVKQFIENLRQKHVKLILKSRIKGKEKGVDIALAVDLLSMAYSNAYDYAIIVSGDVDYISAIEEIKRYGKIVCIASFKTRFNEELTSYADGIIYLDDMVNDFLKEMTT